MRIRLRMVRPGPDHDPTGVRHRRPPILLVLVVLLSVGLLPLGACGRLGRPPTAGTWPSGAAQPRSWQWQLAGPLDLDVDAEIFLLDPVRTTSTEASLLRGRGRRLVCHVNAGAFANTDPDADRFPARVRGAATGPRGTRWLDVRQWSTLKPILTDRLRLCRGKGFEAVALAGLDGYAHRSGFPLSFDDQLLFNRQVAGLARSLNLAPGLVNDVAQAAALTPDFDFAVNEECVRLRQCDKLLSFTAVGKPVLHVEYTGATRDFCVTSLGYGFASIRKNQDLDAWRESCATP